MISHGTGGNLSRDTAAKIQQVYEAATGPTSSRAEDGIARFFSGLEMVPRGLRDAAVWCAAPGAEAAWAARVPRQHREEAVMLTLIRAAGPGRAASTQDAVPTWHVVRSQDVSPGSRAPKCPHQGRPGHA